MGEIRGGSSPLICTIFRFAIVTELVYVLVLETNEAFRPHAGSNPVDSTIFRLVWSCGVTRQPREI